MTNTDINIKSTPLYGKHVELGARMVPFSGWNMPVQYAGIIEEHLHVRGKVGLFDICHMGEFIVKGPSSEKELDGLITCRMDDMLTGKCRYGFLLNEAGGIIDDLIVFKISRDEFMLVVNAGTIEKDKKWITKHLSNEVTFTDISEATAKLDVQGPLAEEIMIRLANRKVIETIKRFCFTYADIEGVRTLISRTGYTGEVGYELFFPKEHAEKLWNLLLSFPEVEPIGLGARDTLRLEKGYSLYGSDLDENHTPLEANLPRFVYMKKDFIGKDALIKQKEAGAERVLAGFLCESRRSARNHFNVLVGGKEIGEVTSGTFSPGLKKGVGLCYIDREFIAEGQSIVLTDGKIAINAKISKLPFC